MRTSHSAIAGALTLLTLVGISIGLLAQDRTRAEPEISHPVLPTDEVTVPATRIRYIQHTFAEGEPRIDELSEAVVYVTSDGSKRYEQSYIICPGALEPVVFIHDSETNERRVIEPKQKLVRIMPINGPGGPPPSPITEYHRRLIMRGKRKEQVTFRGRTAVKVSYPSGNYKIIDATTFQLLCERYECEHDGEHASFERQMIEYDPNSSIAASAFDAKWGIHLTQVAPTSCGRPYPGSASQSATIERYGVGSTATAC